MQGQQRREADRVNHPQEAESTGFSNRFKKLSEGQWESGRGKMTRVPSLSDRWTGAVQRGGETGGGGGDDEFHFG